MIKIGDFSKLAHISIKTLHHYGRLGLLQPVHVDRFSGYRYYDLEQLPRLNRILALKELGFSLEQVAQLLDEDLSPAEMRGMLRMKRLELAEKLEEEQARLERVEMRLRQIEVEGCIPQSEVALKDIPAQTVLLARSVAASEEQLLPARQSLLVLLQRSLDQAHLKAAGPWFALLDDLPYEEQDLEVTLAVGVNLHSSQRAGDWQGTPICLEELDAVPSMASVIHTTITGLLPQTYTSLFKWTQSHGYQVAGPCREIYLSEITENAVLAAGPESSLIEVQCPVEKTSVPASILSPDEKDKEMEPKIVTRPAFKAAGMSYVGKNEHGEIPQTWGVFNQRIEEIKNSRHVEHLGLCFSSIEGAKEGEFEYVCAAVVDDDKNIPEGMVYREIPEYKYAVFTHHGKLDTLGQTYGYIYNTWLPQSGLQLHPDKFDMEVYNEDYIHESDDSKFYIYVAIQ
ncbi:MAG: GyrI-like domain-containing protein [Anaerolineales bacterium]|nr:GyrI-like domain-containing protein [Anaerolineales bacterium]